MTQRACLRAADILRSKGGTALDAVEGAIRELEDSEDLNAGLSSVSSVKHRKILTTVKGYGANLTTDKKIECDASLMESTGAFGAVGAIRGRNALA
jgi:taspase, threonine aspartase, 1